MDGCLHCFLSPSVLIVSTGVTQLVSNMEKREKKRKRISFPFIFPEQILFSFPRMDGWQAGGLQGTHPGASVPQHEVTVNFFPYLKVKELGDHTEMRNEATETSKDNNETTVIIVL